jgi:hypothetical protein
MEFHTLFVGRVSYVWLPVRVAGYVVKPYSPRLEFHTSDLRLMKARVLINLPWGAPGGPGSVTSILNRSLACFAHIFFGPN